MTDIQWDSEASLMRVVPFATTEPQEELVGRGVLRELVGAFLEMPPKEQSGLLLRAAGPGWLQEYDESAIRELAARPEFTSAEGESDTVRLPYDSKAFEEIDVMVTSGGSTDGQAARQGQADTGTA